MPNTFDKTDQLIREWRTLQPIDKVAGKKLEKKFRLEFNYNSNHLEGNTLTYGETELLLLFDDTRGNHTMREYEEMKAHDAAWQLVKDLANDKERPLTEQAIKNINEVILVRPFWKEAITPDGQPTQRQIKIGDYKQYPNSVRLANGELFEYASPAETPILMQELLDWYGSEEDSSHPVTLAAVLHYKFVRIHPFDDGNGRIARLLTNYVLVRNDLPPVIIKSAEKQAYLRSLHIADTGDYDPFINYIAEQSEWSLSISIKAARGENIEDDDDWQKKLHILKNKLGTSTEVAVRKGPEAYHLALKNIIFPLLSSWEANLQKIDPLFNSRRCWVLINNSEAVVYSDDVLTAVEKCFDEKGNLLLPVKNENLDDLTLKIDFSDLRTDTIRGGFNGGGLTINFYENAINITTITNNHITKLYSEVLTDSEVKPVINDLGNWFMNQVEEHINKQS